MTTDNTKITKNLKRILQLYANKLDNLEKMYKFLETKSTKIESRINR